MSSIYLVFLSISISIFFADGNNDEISQWRGPNRDGKFQVTNLLKNWPVDGPNMIWSIDGLGEGHGNVGIGNDRLFVCGMIDSVGHLFSYDMKGNHM